MQFFDATIIITKDDPSGWHASVPELPGCHSFGDSPEEAKENCKEAIVLYLETKNIQISAKVSPQIFIEKISITFPQNILAKQYA